MSSLDTKANIANIQQQTPKNVRLVAVSKGHGVDKVTTALEAGHKIFGENRVQEAIDKFSTIRGKHDFELHMIGHLQSNKAADVLTHFDWLHSVDRENLAKKLSDSWSTQSRCKNMLIQVNIGDEPQKSGIPTAQANEFISHCLHDLNLPIKGLMCVPPADDPEPFLYFGLLRQMVMRYKLPELSMGMSNDWQDAVETGATIIRVGTAIFGERS